MKKIYLVFILLCLSNSFILGAYVRFQSQKLLQPDGTIIECFASGDEYYHWLHDSLGYTIIQNPDDKFFYYGIEKNGLVVPSEYKVGEIIPQQVNLKPWAKISKTEYKKRVEHFNELFHYNKVPNRTLKSARTERFHEGTLNNMVIFIKFKNGADFTKTKEHYSGIYNGSTSLHSYYQEISYSKLSIDSHFFPVNDNDKITLPYEDYHPRTFYQPYDQTTNPDGYQTDDEEVQRRQALLKNALESITAQVPASLVLDKDGNGKIDNISFIIQGSADGWGDLLWPHRSRITRFDVYINDAKAYDYTFQIENTGVTTLCHEMFHMLGAPDLYHYSYDGLAPVGKWDLMENGNGHMGAYMKYEYSQQTWIEELPEITESGRYSLYPLTSSVKNVYKFSPKDVETDEFFVLEYRKKAENSVDNNIPGSGLLIYRINTNYNGNADGPPDEVYIYRPEGSLSVNGKIDEAAYENESGYVLGKLGSPAFLSDGTVSGVKISNISEAGDSIIFNVQLEKSSEADIRSFFLMGQNTNAVINTNTGIIYCNVETGTDLTKSKPIISISDLATISPGSGSLIDLSVPFTYSVTAENGMVKTWTVYVDSQINNQSNIDSINFKGISDIKTQIDAQEKLVKVEVPVTTDFTNLSPVIYTSPASSISPNPDTINNFSEPVSFRVTAEDGVSFTDWLINVSYTTNSATLLSQTSKFDLKIIPGQGITIIKNTEEKALLYIYTIEGILRHNQILKDRINPVKLNPDRVYIISIIGNNFKIQSKLIFK